MQINKEFILKNLITIFCIATVLVLFLPFCTVSAGVSSAYIDDVSTSESITGFNLISNSVFWAYFLLLCPVVLVAINYIEPIKKYKSILSIVLPIIAIISQFIILFASKKSVASILGGEEIDLLGTQISVKLAPAMGFYLLMICYIGTVIAGAMTFYGLQLNKAGITELGNKIKESGLKGLDSLKESTSNAVNSTNVSYQAVNDIPQNTVKKDTNVNKANDVLVLINQLSDMKEQGILTDEEFSEKKKELLTQI